MCGIVGAYSRDGGALAVEPILAMRDAMTHRGPDDAGWWRRPRGANVVLAHRRLSIVDLSPAGRQPMQNEDGSVQITFNGEIYNHAALREQLVRGGHRLRSRSDTEVLVHLWEEYGPAMVDRLVGMFAFGIWDEAAQTLFLARDRLGIKPLYWVDDGRRFAFASEIKALLPLLPSRDIDPTALRHYLTFAAVPPPRTLFRGVSKLAPATTMLVGSAGPQDPVTYWDPIGHRADFDGAAVDWEVELRFRLERAIDRRMMSDVPVGVFLSGGVDSSANVALMSRLIDGPVNTFSVGFKEERYNELAWARRVAESHGTRHHEVQIDAEDLWRLIPDLVHHQDEPIADPVCVPVYFVAELAKRHGVTVVHVGEGADELLAGYPTYVTAERMAAGPWRRFRGLPGPVRGAVARAGAPLLAARPGLQIHSEALRRGGERDAHLWWGGSVAFYERALARISTPELSRDADGESPRDVIARIAADADRHGARDELDRVIYQDLRLRLPELLLMRVDKLTMAHAVEARVPFLDHEVVELAMAMPFEEKIRDGVGKHVLKRALSDLLPQDLLWRPKQGFAAPVQEWFRGELGDRLQAKLRGSAIDELGYLDRSQLAGLLDLHRSGRADRSYQLWNVFNLATWFDHWIAGRDAMAA